MSEATYVTRDEHQAAIKRLDEADLELRKNLADVERVLRTDYEGKINSAALALTQGIGGVKSDIKEDITEVKAHLSVQDETLNKISGQVQQNTWFRGGLMVGITTVGAAAVSVIIYGVNHFLWG